VDRLHQNINGGYKYVGNKELGVEITRSIIMVELTLSLDEAKTLKDALTTYLSELRMEIADTEQQEFRESLKTEEEILKKILESLSG
jgi:hypothetical protein